MLAKLLPHCDIDAQKIRKPGGATLPAHPGSMLTMPPWLSASMTTPTLVTRCQARTRSPAGSYNGSARTSAGTHSPKMSTATFVPGAACATGTYASAMLAPTA